MTLHVRHSSGTIRWCGVPSDRDAVDGDLVVIALNGLADGGNAYGTDFLSTLNPIEIDGVKFMHCTL